MATPLSVDSIKIDTYNEVTGNVNSTHFHFPPESHRWSQQPTAEVDNIRNAIGFDFPDNTRR